MKVYDAIANAFVKEGGTTIFGLLGDGQMPWWSAMSEYPGVKIIDARDEGCALSMAEGWAMATGKVGVASSTHGPGLARMATSLVVATRSHTPCVVYTSKVPTANGYHSQQLDQAAFVGATGAGYIEVQSPSFAESAVRQAFYRARLESKPIVIGVPTDVQKMECDADGDDYVPSTVMFPGQQPFRPSVERVRAAAAIIAKSRKPVIVLGRGAKSPEAKAAAEKLAKRIGALVATTLMGKGTLAEAEFHVGISGLFSHRDVMALFADADCVIAIGASLSLHTVAGGYLYPEAKFIHIDTAPHVMMGNERGADCYVQGEAGAATTEILDQLVNDGFENKGYRTPDVRKALQNATRDPAEFEIEPGTVDPREAARLIDERLPSNVGVVSSANAHACSFRAMLMNKPRPLNIFLSAFGCIGQALSTGIGAAVASDFPIACIEGDGGALQAIQELDTAGRLGIKFLYVVMNDDAYGAEYHKLKAHGKNVNLSVVKTPDFAGLGRDFGCRGQTARTLDELGAAVDEFVAGEGPMVVDLRISRNVISIPYRRVHFGQDV